MKTEVHQIITAQIIEAIDKKKLLPWSMPWNIQGMRNAVTKKLYRGINVFLLTMFGGDNYFLTFKQAKALGGYPLPKTGLVICFFRYLESKNQVDKNGKPRRIPMLRYYRVHPVNKCVDLKWTRPAQNLLDFVPCDKAESMVAMLQGVPITHGGDSAHYTPAIHAIQMPQRETFKSVNFYYKTLFHEIGHSLYKVTEEKLDTNMGSASYSKEELTAEIFASFCLNHCGLLVPEVFDNSAAYIKGWRKRLTDDPTLVISAASKAQRRFDALLGIVPEAEQASEEQEAQA